jgi:hypothetical protein
LHGKRPNWPEEVLLENSSKRKDYIQSLRNADAGDYLHLERIMIGYGGKNPSPSEVQTLPIFKRNFSLAKTDETLRNLSKL